jgi:hypothetical protein
MDAMQLISDFGLPAGLCFALLYGFKKLGEVALTRIVDPVIESHREFLAKLEEQLELQGGLVKQMVDLQEEILRKLE